MSANAADAVLFDQGGDLTGPVRHSIAAWLTDDRIDPIVISGGVGLRKPHSAMYELALGPLVGPVDRVPSLDEAEPSVPGARRVRLQALLHVDTASTRADLAGLAPDLNPPPTGVSA